MKISKILLLLFALCQIGLVYAETRISVLDFELKDLTLLPNQPQELARTASIKTLLIAELEKAGFVIIPITDTAQHAADGGVGYLFDHADVAAQMGKTVGADYVIVGRLHKPSFLFAYLMAHVVDVKTGAELHNLQVESKGGDKKLTGKAVEALAEKISTLVAH